MERYPNIRYPGNVPGILYEPRALWSIESVDTASIANGRVLFPRNDFLNSGKYPIVLSEVLLAPVNYHYITADAGVDPPTGVLNYHIDGVSALGFSQLLINAPQRQAYSRTVIPMTSWPAEPRWTPTIRGIDLAGTGTEENYPSSIWGVTRWDFAHPMIIPKLGTLEIALSPFNYALDTPEVADLRQVNFAIGVSEGPPPASSAPGRVGNFPGNLRVHPRSILRYYEETSPFRTSGQGGTGIPAQSQQRQVFDFAPESVGGPLTTTQQWPSDQQLSAREYDRQNASEAGSTPVHGFGVQIDQIDYDDFTVNDEGPVAGMTDQPISPLAMRVATKARMRNGGTGEFWWRPGAPLALVQPTMTPALVYRLPQPITLAPGDTLDVELQVQRPVTIGANTIEQKYNLGLSFCGFAAIEG